MATAVGSACIGAVSLAVKLQELRVEQTKQWHEVWDPYTKLWSEGGFHGCGVAAVTYEVQEGDNLRNIFIGSEIKWPGIQIEEMAEVAEVFNPLLSFDANKQALGWRNPSLLYPGDVIVLPGYEGSYGFVGRMGQFPYPGAPENATAELVRDDSEAMRDLKVRVKDALSGGTSAKAIRDRCILAVHNMGRDVSDEQVAEQVLAEYQLRYGSDFFIREMYDYIVPGGVLEVNKILEAAGVESRLPKNLEELAIIKPIANSEGGGSTNVELRPNFMIYGLYDRPNSLGYSRNRIDRFVGDNLHEALHGIQPLAGTISESEWEYAHAAMDVVTSAVWVMERKAINNKVLYVFNRLVESGMEPGEAYRLMVRSSISF